MNKISTLSQKPRPRRLTVFAAGLGVAFLSGAASAQINRSAAPSTATPPLGTNRSFTPSVPSVSVRPAPSAGGSTGSLSFRRSTPPPIAAGGATGSGGFVAGARSGLPYDRASLEAAWAQRGYQSSGRRGGGADPYARATPLITGPVVTNPGATFDRFNRTRESYTYRNGITGRNNIYYYPWWGSLTFPNSYAAYPYYYRNYIYGLTYPSLYSPYYGLCPPYIGSGAVYVNPPQYLYVPYPVYVDGTYQGYRHDDVDSYYLNRDQEAKEYRVGERDVKRDRELDNAIADIRQAWREGDIQLLSKHLRRDAKVAVTLRGKYQYSLDSNDYLDLTRDAFRTTKTVRFELDQVRRRGPNTYTLSGRHVYKDSDGKERTVYVSYVLEKQDSEYIITQVGTAPDVVEE